MLSLGNNREIGLVSIDLDFLYFLFESFEESMSLYLRALVSRSSFSKSLRSERKAFLDGNPVLSASSWSVSSLPSFKAAMTCSSTLFSFIF